MRKAGTESPMETEPLQAKARPEPPSGGPSVNLGKEPLEEHCEKGPSSPGDRRQQTGLGRWRYVLRAAVGVCLILLLLRKTSLAEIAALLAGAASRWPLIFLALAVPGLAVIVAVWRWRVLLAGAGKPPKLLRLLRAFLVGSFFNHLLPTTMGGDVARGWRIRNQVGSAELSFAVVGLDRLIGVLGICAVGLAALALRPDILRQMPELRFVLWGVGSAVAALTVALHPRSLALVHSACRLPKLWSIRAKLAAIQAGLALLWGKKWRLAFAFVLSIVLQMVVICQFGVLGWMLQTGLNLSDFAVIIPIVTLVTILPVSINGIGVRETALAVMGTPFGLDVSQATALGLLFIMASTFYAVVGGFIYTLESKKTRTGG